MPIMCTMYAIWDFNCICNYCQSHRTGLSEPLSITQPSTGSPDFPNAFCIITTIIASSFSAFPILATLHCILANLVLNLSSWCCISFLIFYLCKMPDPFSDLYQISFQIYKKVNVTVLFTNDNYSVIYQLDRE